LIFKSSTLDYILQLHTTYSRFTFTTMAHDSPPKGSMEIIKIEDATPNVNVGYRQQYPLLADKTDEEIKALNKAVLKKLDWKFLPCITVMLLMKYVQVLQVRVSLDNGLETDSI
jgi:hypothetical protein